MELKIKEIIRNIKLYELGILVKLDGHDALTSLGGLNSFKGVDPNETYYGKVNDIKFRLFNKDTEYISIKYELWRSIKDSFNLSHIETKELTMWAIGGDPNLKGVPTWFRNDTKSRPIGRM